MYWPDGPTGPGGAGQPAGGLSCTASHDNASYHVHPHLSIFLNGQQLRVPSGIGIGGSGAPAPGCLYAVHTHDAIGILHVENPTPARFTLGQFFALWGQPLSSTNVAGITGLPVVIWLDDGRTVTQYTGDPREIELAGGRGITVQIGTPLSALPTYTY